MRTSPSRNRKSPEEWKALLERHEQSGLSQREFCRQAGISLSSFARRRREMQDRSSAFVELPAPQEASLAPKENPVAAREDQWSVEVLLPNGSVLRFHA